MTTTTEDTMTQHTPTAAEQAETMARVTGSRSATFTVERVQADGTVVVDHTATWALHPEDDHAPVLDRDGDLWVWHRGGFREWFADQLRFSTAKAYATRAELLAEFGPEQVL